MKLTDSEAKERMQLMALQKRKDRWFSQLEFDRLKELNIKALKGEKP